MIMRNIVFTFAAVLLSFQVSYSQFFADGKVVIDENIGDDVYAAGETVIIEAIVEGDLLAAGNEIEVNNRVEEDLIVGGGSISVNSSVGDDARVAGGYITISNIIEDDLVVAGGHVVVEEFGLIKGNLISYGGTIEMYGDVEGDVKIYGGDLNLSGDINGSLDARAGDLVFNGTVKGTSIIAARNLELGSDADFKDDVRYWSKNDDYDIRDFVSKGAVEFDEELEVVKDRDWEFGNTGSAFWWILQLTMVGIIAALFNTLFPNAFRKVQSIVKSDTGRSFGYGLLYIIFTPVLSLFLIVIIIGIPIGLTMLLLYVMTLLFATTLVSLVTAYYLDEYYHRNWNSAEIIGITMLCFAIIKFVGLIPYAGWIFKILLIAIVFGGIILLIINKPKRTSTEIVQGTT